MIKITTHAKNSKMDGIGSISTSPLLNKNCSKNRKVDGSVCQKCYSHTYNKMRPSLREALKHNTRVLTERVLKNSELPLINAGFFRLESFGDLNNSIQLENYCRLAEKNAHCQFSLWTKNSHLIEEYFSNSVFNPKPKNLKIICSSLILNEQADITTLPFVDKVFTVYTRDYIKEHGININCGSKHCLSCQRCYGKKHNNMKYIREVKK
jgi:hypothetical protein